MLRPMNMPKLSPTMEEGTIAQWLKAVGDFVEAGELLLEVTTDKATIECTAFEDGYLRKILVEKGKKAIVNQPIALFSETKDEPIESFSVSPPPSKAQTEIQAEEQASIKPQGKEKGLSFDLSLFDPPAPLTNYFFPYRRNEGESYTPLASPLAKSLAKKRGVDLSAIVGTGPNGRIMSRDLEKAPPLKSPISRSIPSTHPGSYEREPLSPMRRVIGERLQASKSVIPHFYLEKKLQVSSLVSLREELKKGGLPITFNDLILKAVALALFDHPTINSGYDPREEAILRFTTVDIAVAVALPAGLITPIIRHAAHKTLLEIHGEMRMLLTKAKEGKLKEEEYKGGSFTMSNLGMFEIDSFSAIINPPQGAILAIGAIQKEAVIQDNRVVPGETLTLRLSCDHRVIDGAEGAKFLMTIAKKLASPALLLL